MKRLSFLLIVAAIVSLCGCGGASKQAVGVALTPGTALTLVQGQQKSFSVTVSNDTNSQGVTWTLSGASCTGAACGSLSGVTISSVTYTAPATVSSSMTVTLTATSVADATKSAAITITLAPPPSVTTTTLTAGVQDVAYTATTLAASGGITPYTWSVTVGSLPAGMTLSSAGVLSGKPTTAATTNFTVQVSDSSSPALTATKALSIVVNPPPALSVSSASLASGVQNSAYSATLAATGGTPPYTAWSVTVGTLPAGLTLHSATGVIDGTPTAVGASNFTVQVTDSTTPALTATKALSIAIAPPPLTITTTTLPGGTVNSTYTATTLVATGGTAPISWAVTTGSLPAGLTLHSSTGVIDGTPTASGTVNFTVTATDSQSTPATKTQALSIVVAPALSITTTSLPDGGMNTSYTATLATTGGTGAVTWSVTLGSLPAGLTLHPATGVIDGTPTTAEKVDFTVQATDHSTPPATPTKALSITIAAVPLAINTTTLPGGTVGGDYTATLNATGGTPPIAWTVTTGVLPNGLQLHSATGVIDGQPTTAGTVDFTVTATDSGSPVQTKPQALRIVIAPAFTITTTTLPDGTQNTAYTSTTLVVTGGTAPFTFAVVSGGLPDGITLNSSTGVISGTPTGAGTFNFSLQATDHSVPPQTPQVALSIKVTAAPLTIETTTLPNGTIGTAYNATLQTNGGTGSVTWTVTLGSLPGWATLNASTGAITGTPTGSPTTTNFTVKATDDGLPQQTKTQALGITTVTGGANNAELNGHYAFVLRGFDSIGHGLVVTAGTFVANGSGTVTGGVMDINTTSTNHTSLAITGGYYSVGADQRGTLTLTTSQGNSTFAFTLGQITSGVAAYGHVIGSDSNLVAGDMKKQDTSAFSTASFNGNFAFGIAGAVSAGRFAAAGVITFNSAGTYSMLMDYNSAGEMNDGSSSPVTTVGTWAIDDATNGRITMNDTTMGSHMAVYVASATEAFIIEIDPFTNNGAPMFAGSALKQSGTFSNSAMNGTKSVFIGQSVSSYSGGVPAAAYNGIGLFSWTTTGNMTGEIDENDGGVYTHTTGMTGTYNVASNGRMTITPTGGVSGGGSMPVFYLVSPGKAFSVSSNGSDDEGMLKPQSSGSFDNSSLAGDYVFGVYPPVMNSSKVDVGIVHLDGVNAITGTDDQNSAGTMQSHSITDTYSVSSNGRVVLSTNVMYVISTSKAVMMSTESGQTDPTLHMIDQ